MSQKRQNDAASEDSHHDGACGQAGERAAAPGVCNGKHGRRDRVLDACRALDRGRRVPWWVRDIVTT